MLVGKFKAMPSKYTIKDLERISGIKAHTLRIWEQRYEILNPERSSTNIRYYNDDDLKRILNISFLNNNGFKISNIAKLNDKSLLEEVGRFFNSYQKESDQIENLIRCLMDMDEERFEKTITNSIEHFGFESTIENIIFPFFRHLGNMWQLGVVTPAQEHYISNLIRQKLIVGIDQLKPVILPEAKTYLFFLPNQELHEMGLLYAYYLVKSRGHKCLYLGQSVPLEDLATISETVKPNFLVSIITATMQDTSLNEFISLCDSKIPGPEFLLSGRLVLSVEEAVKLPSSRFKTFADFDSFKKMI
jgi:DNA-binding transcriptional MerR regulator